MRYIFQMKKKISAVLLVFALLVTAFYGPGAVTSQAKGKTDELRGVWVSYCDFQRLGLANKNEKSFRSNYNAFLNKAKKDHLNAIYFHVRSFDDAAWKSKTFPAMKALKWNASRSKSAAKTYTYDPMKIAVELTHKKGMEFHAWLNPYRKTTNYYLDPGYGTTRDRIVKAVNEIMAYKVDGIHFDDYFYNAKVGYVNLRNKRVAGKPSYSTRQNNVSILVRRVHSAVKKADKNAVFGISPQGNMQNAKNLGCDIKKWMSTNGYVDYIMPQLYWTDNWGSMGNTKMFTRTLNNWTAKGLNKVGMPVYIGFAVYKSSGWTGDPGWRRSSSNLSKQLKMLRKKKCDGYVLFSAKELYRKGASKEISNLNKVV